VTEPQPDLFGQPIRPDPVAVDRDQFIAWIVDRYLAKSTIDRGSAEHFAEAFFGAGGLLPAFDHPAFEWTKSAAYDLADEDMSYWEGE
jgi:hypothetical protein